MTIVLYCRSSAISSPWSTSLVLHSFAGLSSLIYYHSHSDPWEISFWQSLSTISLLHWLCSLFEILSCLSFFGLLDSFLSSCLFLFFQRLSRIAFFDRHWLLLLLTSFLSCRDHLYFLQKINFNCLVIFGYVSSSSSFFCCQDCFDYLRQSLPISLFWTSLFCFQRRLSQPCFFDLAWLFLLSTPFLLSWDRLDYFFSIFRGSLFLGFVSLSTRSFLFSIDDHFQLSPGLRLLLSDLFSFPSRWYVLSIRLFHQDRSCLCCSFNPSRLSPLPLRFCYSMSSWLHSFEYSRISLWWDRVSSIDAVSVFFRESFSIISLSISFLLFLCEIFSTRFLWPLLIISSFSLFLACRGHFHRLRAVDFNCLFAST